MTLLPSYSSSNPEDILILQKVSSLRREYQRGKLPQAHIDMVEKAFPDWTWNSRENEWNISYQKTLELAVKNQKIPKRKKGDKEESVLGEWCSKQRRKHKSGKLSEEKIKKLEAIPGWYWFVWRHTWIFHFDKIEKECRKLGTIPSYSQWLYKQRGKYRKGLLRDWQVEKLESLPGWFWEQPSAYDKMKELFGEETAELFRK